MTKRFNFVLTTAELKKLDQLAKLEGRTRGDYLRRLIERKHAEKKAGETLATHVAGLPGDPG